jgi:hypothetical protein
MKKLFLLVFILGSCVSYKPVIPEGEVLSQFGKILEVKEDQVKVEFKSMSGDPQRVAIDWFYFPGHSYRKGDFLKLDK